jgi:hypothetical protein
MKMEPMWITTLMSALIVFLTLAIPVVLIAYGVSLGLSWVRGGTRVIPRQPYDQSKRLLLAVVAIVVGLLWLFLSFNLAVMPAQSPFLVILPVLFFILAQLSIWVLITEVTSGHRRRGVARAVARSTHGRGGTRARDAAGHFEGALRARRDQRRTVRRDEAPAG